MELVVDAGCLVASVAKAGVETSRGNWGMKTECVLFWLYSTWCPPSHKSADVAAAIGVCLPRISWLAVTLYRNESNDYAVGLFRQSGVLHV